MDSLQQVAKELNFGLFEKDCHINLNQKEIEDLMIRFAECKDKIPRYFAILSPETHFFGKLVMVD